MKPKAEIVLTFLIPILSIVAIIGALKNDAPRSKIIFSSVNGLLWFIIGIIKLHKHKKMVKFIKIEKSQVVILLRSPTHYKEILI